MIFIDSPLDQCEWPPYGPQPIINTSLALAPGTWPSAQPDPSVVAISSASRKQRGVSGGSASQRPVPQAGRRGERAPAAAAPQILPPWPHGARKRQAVLAPPQPPPHPPSLSDLGEAAGEQSPVGAQAPQLPAPLQRPVEQPAEQPEHHRAEQPQPGKHPAELAAEHSNERVVEQPVEQSKDLPADEQLSEQVDLIPAEQPQPLPMEPASEQAPLEEQAGSSAATPAEAVQASALPTPRPTGPQPLPTPLLEPSVPVAESCNSLLPLAAEAAASVEQQHPAGCAAPLPPPALEAAAAGGTAWLQGALLATRGGLLVAAVLTAVAWLVRRVLAARAQASAGLGCSSSLSLGRLCASMHHASCFHKCSLTAALAPSHRPLDTNRPQTLCRSARRLLRRPPSSCSQPATR